MTGAHGDQGAAGSGECCIRQGCLRARMAESLVCESDHRRLPAYLRNQFAAAFADGSTSIAEWHRLYAKTVQILRRG
jgi:hypothetical protein